MSCECKQVKTTRNYYRYSDSPEGCDIFRKMMALSRTGAVIGVILGTEDILFYSHAVGLAPMLRRYIFHAAPWMLMGATFAGVANSLYQYRNKDDHLNYFLGGFACGPIVAAYLGSYHAVLLGGLFLGTLAACKKEAMLKNVDVFPTPSSSMRSLNHWRRDYTFMKDPLIDMQHTCGQQK